MPAITLTEAAKPVLQNYRWPGNIRQLKNITEQISVIEQEREISPEILREYLPVNEVGIIPVSQTNTDQKLFGSEREILYQVLFDMRKDMTELKKVVRDLVAGKVASTDVVLAKDDSYPSLLVPETESSLVKYTEEPSVIIPATPTDIEPSEYEEQTLSLEEVEKEMIKKALERHGGKRKNAAEDLKISERTLYRKIKEYNLE